MLIHAQIRNARGMSNMWYKIARQLVAADFGSFPQIKKRLDQIATPEESDQLSQEAILNRQPKPWSQRTIEERLDGFRPDLDNYTRPTPETLLDVAGNQSAVIGNEPNQTGRPRSGGGHNPTFRSFFPANPDPREKLKLR